MIAHLRRRLYWYVSVAVHAVLLALLYYHGAWQPAMRAQAREIAASTAMSSHAQMRSRVADMERIKELMQQSMGQAAEEQDVVPRFDATSAAAQPEALLAQAETLAREIDSLSTQAREAEAARLQVDAGAPPEHGPARASDDPPAAGQAGPAPDTAGSRTPPAQASPASLAELADVANRPRQANQANQAGQPAPGERIAHLASRAREALAQRQQQLQRAQQGISVEASSRIASFINRDVALVGEKSGGYRGTGIELFGAGAGRMPRVDEGSLFKANGRIVGKGGAYTNRLYVNSWYLIGPFEGKHGLALFDNFSHPPEQAVLLDAAYRGKDGRFLTWRYVSSQTYPLVPPDAVEDGVYYGYTELMFDEAREMAVWIGGDDDAKVWINDRQVWKGGNSDKAWFWEEIYGTRNNHASRYNLTEGIVRVHFRKGRNKVFFKVANGPSRMYFSMVLTPP